MFCKCTACFMAPKRGRLKSFTPSIKSFLVAVVVVFVVAYGVTEHGVLTRMLHDRIYLLTALVFFAFFVIGMVGLVSPAWRSGHYGSSEYVDSGLLTRCHHYVGLSFHRCAPFSMGSQTAWFEVSRILCCVSMTLLFALTVGSCFLHFVDRHREDYVYLLAASVLTGILGFVGAVVYAMRSSQTLLHFKADLSWGWAVFLSDVLSVGIVSLIFMAWIKNRKRKPKLKQVAPLRG